MHRHMAKPTTLRRWAAALGTAGLLASAAAAQEREAAMTCTNPASGASWRIAIDFGKGTVDANRAEITPAKVSWFDPKDGGNYVLDRSTGDLRAIVASSTGGYFRRAHCAVEKAR